MMTDEQRARYHGRWWPDACQVKGWRVKDDVRRRDVVMECMRLVRGPSITTSHPDFGDNETTALRTYLEFLANPASLEKSQRWLDCQKDYVAFNRARQADWHERHAYGPKGSGKFARSRFAGARSAQGEAQETFDPQEARKRHISMASRNRKKTGYRSTKQAAGEYRFVVMVNGRELVGAGTVAPKPAAPAGEELDENCPF